MNAEDKELEQFIKSTILYRKGLMKKPNNICPHCGLQSDGDIWEMQCKLRAAQAEIEKLYRELAEARALIIKIKQEPTRPTH